MQLGTPGPARMDPNPIESQALEAAERMPERMPERLPEYMPESKSE